MIPEVCEELGCNNWVYIPPHFIKQYGLNKRQEQVGVNPDPDEEQIDDVALDDDRERHWCMVFEDSNGGTGGKKAPLHTNRWDVYNLQKESLVKGGYLFEVSDKYVKKVI